MPESASSPTHFTVTSALYQPAPFGSAGTPTSVGLVWSMFTGPYVVELRLPATSTASPVTVWPRPSLASVVSPAQPATPVRTPEPPSSQTNVTSTAVLFHPALFAAGDWLPVMVGAVVSTWTLTKFVVAWASALPAMSTLQ